ncbi:DUF6233 domain-containing protein [Streptomyces roseus]|uniref:DUF6233 domain-containing protein n=1 Tax=Streptomyces roseus TaxID=66430 RepID=UPI0037FBB445
MGQLPVRVHAGDCWGTRKRCTAMTTDEARRRWPRGPRLPALPARRRPRHGVAPSPGRRLVACSEGYRVVRCRSVRWAKAWSARRRS